mmetsp:Transcript_54764/g.163790  ORF Transcript_54764/g.163790 Transcript_54764/m.163790 type:complete len:277 (-) Transcript_54764:1482-2312(-)
MTTKERAGQRRRNGPLYTSSAPPGRTSLTSPTKKPASKERGGPSWYPPPNAPPPPPARRGPRQEPRRRRHGRGLGLYGGAAFLFFFAFFAADRPPRAKPTDIAARHLSSCPPRSRRRRRRFRALLLLGRRRRRRRRGRGRESAREREGIHALRRADRGGRSRGIIRGDPSETAVREEREGIEHLRGGKGKRDRRAHIVGERLRSSSVGGTPPRRCRLDIRIERFQFLRGDGRHRGCIPRVDARRIVSNTERAAAVSIAQRRELHHQSRTAVSIFGQ